MSIRADKLKPDSPDAVAAIEAAANDAALGEGNSFCVASPDNPLKRNVVVSIRASLNDLCLSKSKGVWQPSGDALKQIFQQKKFTSLDGSADSQGDLKVIRRTTLQTHAHKNAHPNTQACFSPSAVRGAALARRHARLV